MPMITESRVLSEKPEETGPSAIAYRISCFAEPLVHVHR